MRVNLCGPSARARVPPATSTTSTWPTPISRSDLRSAATKVFPPEGGTHESVDDWLMRRHSRCDADRRRGPLTEAAVSIGRTPSPCHTGRVRALADRAVELGTMGEG